MSVLDQLNDIRTSAADPVTTRLRMVVYGSTLVAILFPTLSAISGVSDHVLHWGKLVHAVDGFCVALVFGLLFLAWRTYEKIDITDELGGLFTVCVGVVFGLLWEFVGFILDWTTDSDFQKSNTDSMTDFLCNDVAVVIATLIAVRAVSHLSSRQTRGLGATAEWLVDGPSYVLDRHGFALAIVASLVIAAAVVSLWLSGRPLPGVPIP